MSNLTNETVHKLQVHLNQQQLTALNHLVNFGLYGNTLTEVAKRLIDSGLLTIQHEIPRPNNSRAK